MVRCVGREFHKSLNRVPSFLLQSMEICHGEDFCVVARQKQLQTFGKILEKRFEEN